MSRPKVELHHYKISPDLSHLAGIDIVVDGKTICTGTYGGEPEDNTRDRDYAWVGRALRQLAGALGAEVEDKVVRCSEKCTFRSYYMGGKVCGACGEKVDEVV